MRIRTPRIMRGLKIGDRAMSRKEFPNLWEAIGRWGSIHNTSHFILFLKSPVSKNGVRPQIGAFLREIWPILWICQILVLERAFPGQIEGAGFKNHLSRAIGAVEQGVLSKIKENKEMYFDLLGIVWGLSGKYVGIMLPGQIEDAGFKNQGLG